MATATLVIPGARQVVGGSESDRQAHAVLGIKGNSKALRDVLSRVQRVAPYYRTALITGETGTGKELVVRALHDLSKVRDGQFVAINCSAITETLFESELFGHVRGAFTDASRDKVGLFELAHQGTLFLDEIGDMPLSTQAKLLRVLQNQEVQRVGSLTGRRVDVHVVAATNKDLRREVEAKRFREDLYYRLSMVEIEVPPLRERAGDISLLAQHFGEKWALQYGKPFGGISPAVRECLETYAWPGNVRELENVIGYASMLADDEPLGLGDLPEYLLDGSRPTPQNATSWPLQVALNGGACDVLEEYERRLVLQALDQTGHNQARAARALRTTRDRLRYKMKKYGLIETHAMSALSA